MEKNPKYPYQSLATSFVSCRIVYIQIAIALISRNLRNENIIPSRVWNID